MILQRLCVGVHYGAVTVMSVLNNISHDCLLDAPPTSTKFNSFLTSDISSFEGVSVHSNSGSNKAMSSSDKPLQSAQNLFL